MIRILNAEPHNYSDQARYVLESVGELHEQSISRHELLDRLANYDVLIVRLGLQINRQVINAGRQLKAIVTATTGLDHIDVDYAQSQGIAVLSLKDEVEFLRSIPATAEHTWALLLSLVRRIPWAFRSVLEDRWDRDAFRGRDLFDKRLGILGLGRIGEKVARYGLVFGMSVAAHDPYRKDWPKDVKRWSRLEDLLSESDVLSIHVPLNAETNKLIEDSELAMLPPGALLVNTSRGAIIDEMALLAALRSGHLSGAALDVMINERDDDARSASPLVAYARDHHNLLLTPHLGGATVESMARTEVFMAKKLERFLQSEEML